MIFQPKLFLGICDDATKATNFLADFARTSKGYPYIFVDVTHNRRDPVWDEHLLVAEQKLRAGKCVVIQSPVLTDLTVRSRFLALAKELSAKRIGVVIGIDPKSIAYPLQKEEDFNLILDMYPDGGLKKYRGLLTTS